MKLSKTRITIAGVFRCCIASFNDQNDHEVNAGDRFACKHCGEQFQLVESLWTPLWQLKP